MCITGQIRIFNALNSDGYSTGNVPPHGNNSGWWGCLESLRPAIATGLQHMKQFAHNLQLPCCQCTETWSHVSSIQNNTNTTYQYRCYSVIMKFLCGSLAIFNALRKVWFLCSELIRTRNTYPNLHLHIHMCTSIFLHIDVYKEIFLIFHYLILLLYSKGYTHSLPGTSPARAEWDISNYIKIYLLLIKMTCHRTIKTALLVKANKAVNKMLPWADHFA